MRQSSRWTSAVCEARMPCFFTFAPCSQPLVPGGMTKPAWPREPSSRSTDAIDDVDVGDAAVGRPRLLAVEHPLVLGLVVLGGGAKRRDVGAGVGLGDAERARPWGRRAVPKHCGTHSIICSGVPEE